MSQLSNADKQARFRKKEHLKRRAANIFFEWRFGSGIWKLKNVSQEDFRYSLDKAIDLPSGWTDKDYERAEQALEQFRKDFLYASDQLTKDVDARFAQMEGGKLGEFRRASDAAIENARALATHIISALKLSSCDDADKAAALMEAVRFVGRSLSSHSDLPRSQAVTMCLTSIGPEYDRPEWFEEELDYILRQIRLRLARKVNQQSNK